MAFMINATDTSGQLSLRRDSAEGVVKKAAELIADACWDVRITAPDGREYAAGEFEHLAEVQA